MAESKFEADMVKKTRSRRERWAYREDLSYVPLKILEAH